MRGGSKNMRCFISKMSFWTRWSFHDVLIHGDCDTVRATLTEPNQKQSAVAIGAQGRPINENGVAKQAAAAVKPRQAHLTTCGHLYRNAADKEWQRGEKPATGSKWDERRARRRWGGERSNTEQSQNSTWRKSRTNPAPSASQGKAAWLVGLLAAWLADKPLPAAFLLPHCLHVECSARLSTLSSSRSYELRCPTGPQVPRGAIWTPEGISALLCRVIAGVLGRGGWGGGSM